MSSFQDALRKAGIPVDQTDGYSKKNAGAFTLEMKLYEMQYLPLLTEMRLYMYMRIIKETWKRYFKMFRITEMNIR